MAIENGTIITIRTRTDGQQHAQVEQPRRSQLGGVEAGGEGAAALPHHRQPAELVQLGLLVMWQGRVQEQWRRRILRAAGRKQRARQRLRLGGP